MVLLDRPLEWAQAAGLCWNDGAAPGVWIPLPRVSTQTCHLVGGPVDARAGGVDFVRTPEPVYAPRQVCVAGVALRVSFPVCIVDLGGLSMCETGYDSSCVCS